MIFTLGGSNGQISGLKSEIAEKAKQVAIATLFPETRSPLVPQPDPLTYGGYGNV